MVQFFKLTHYPPLQFSRAPTRIIKHWGALVRMEPGQLVLVTLHNPRENIWGMMRSLDQAGVNVRGVDLQSLDDFTQLVKSGEPVTASVVFFPMHRVQRIEEDNRSGELPSLAEQFRAKTGLDVRKFFQEPRG